MGSALPLIAIYLYTKYLNASSSLKVICWTRYRTDGWTDGWMNKAATKCLPFGEHKNISQPYQPLIKMSTLSLSKEMVIVFFKLE